MSSMRENPIRRRPPSKRPSWLVGVLAGAAVLVIIAVVVAIRMLTVGSGDEDFALASESAVPCQTATVAVVDVLPKSSKVKVNVFNATKSEGLAGKVARQLKGFGFVIKDTANDPVGKPIAVSAQIRYGAKGEAGAQLLAIYLPNAELVNDGRKGKVIDVALGDGFTALATTAEVDAALASASPVPSGPACATAS